MQNQTNHEDFLKQYNIEFPPPSALNLLHAEPITLIKNQGYTFSADAFELINELVEPSGMSAVQFNRWIGSGDGHNHHQILFFLDRSCYMANHIISIRESIDEIAMTSYLGIDAHTNMKNDPPPAGLLFVADVCFLSVLAQFSPFLELLLPIANGPSDGGMWAYFLGRAEYAVQEMEMADEIGPV